MADLEQSKYLIITTFLDPRFKNFGFSNDSVAERAKELVIAMQTIDNKEQQEPFPINKLSDNVEESSIWEVLIKKSKITNLQEQLNRDP